MEIDEVSGENSITPVKRRESQKQIIRPNDFIISPEHRLILELDEESKDKNEDGSMQSSLPSGSD